MTVEQLLKKGIEILQEGDLSNPFLDAQLLLCYALNVDKIYIYTQKDRQVNEENVDNFLRLVDKRKSGYPLQYIIRKQEFMGLDFFVKEGVLVPRPDTEILVETVINIVEKGQFKDKDELKIVDIGAGSGAITLSLAHYIKNAFVYSVDISEEALKVAKKNCDNMNLQDRVKFLQGDLLNPLKEYNLLKNIDIIVSNPPYIPSKDIEDLQTEVSKYEPRLALDGGEDGLKYYRRIIEQSTDYLVDGGLLAFEIGYDQGKEVSELLRQNKNFEDIRVIKDLAGHDRVVVGKIIYN